MSEDFVSEDSVAGESSAFGKSAPGGRAIDDRAPLGPQDSDDMSAHSAAMSELGIGTAAAKIVTARGTEDGLVLRIDGKAEWAEILSEIRSFLGSRRRFLEGGEVAVEWLERLPTREQGQELEDFLLSQFDIRISQRRRRPTHTMITIEGKQFAEGRQFAEGSLRRQRQEERPDERSARIAREVEELQHRQPLDTPHQSGPVRRAGNEKLSPDGAKSAGGRLRNEISFSREREGRTLRRRDSSNEQIKMDTNMSFDDRTPDNFSGDDFSGGEARTPASRRGNRQHELDSEAPAGAFSIGRTTVGGTYAENSDIGAAHESFQRPAGHFATNVSKLLGDEILYEEDANAKVVYGTLRSGQRVETPFSLVVMGDVNPGAELVAGGDIFVLGSLRGTAHAAAYDDDCQDRVIFALQMQPMQLRIGSIISRGSGDAGRVAEIARVESRRIVVDAFVAKSAATKRPKF